MGWVLLAQTAEPVIESPSVAWWGLIPLIILAAGGLLLLTIASLIKPLPQWFFALWTVAVAIGTLIATIPPWTRVHHHGAISTLSGMYGVDGFSLFVTGVIAAAVAIAALLAIDYSAREGIEGPELFVLMLLSAAGGVVMASANDLIVMFLGLETLSIAVYVMAAMNLRRVQSQEAGMKYFVLGAFSSAFLLYGIALAYGATGSTNLATIKSFLATNTLTDDTMLLAAFALMLVGFGFKVAAVPFHSWTPDVYQGAPSPVVAFMASAVKIAGFAGLLRVFVAGFGQYASDWQPAVYAIAVLTLLFGAVLAVVQSDVKRMLAYSSISHAGFVLVGVQAASDHGTSAALYYLAAYAFMVAGSFGVVTVVGGASGGDHSLAAYRGLGSRRPLLALAFTILLLAQAGVPLTTGFFAKFEVIEAAVDARSFWLAITAMLSAVIAAYLYLRIVFTMYMLGGDHEASSAGGADAGDGPRVRVAPTAALAVAVTVLVTVGFGILPDFAVNLARDAVPVIVAAG
jgi:NADH-quinone oxidoreductase subunit N